MNHVLLSPLANSPDVDESRMDALDRSHGVARHYRVVDAGADAKRRAKLAFLSYERAQIEGDQEHAAVARQRFLAASEELAMARRARGGAMTILRPLTKK